MPKNVERSARRCPGKYVATYVVLVGPSGSGKSSLAKVLAGTFGHAPTKASGGRAAPRVKAGKSRRHGGYGI